MHPMVGRTLGPYRIDTPLGKGGMGEVFRAYQSTLDRDVAIKLLYPHMLIDEDVATRFRQEAQAAARLRHSNIVQVYDFGESDGTFYMVMELLDGPSLRGQMRRLADAGQLAPLDDVALAITQLGDALDYAHAHGVLHRDIKPDNVMLVRPMTQSATAGPLLLASHRLVITDFGLAKLTDHPSRTRTGHIAGTPAYMSPEQCQGLPLDARADVYALGVVLYELLTGRTPFDADSAPMVIYQQINAPPPDVRSLRADLPPAIADVLALALAKKPAERYASAGALARDFTSALRTAPGAAFVPTVVPVASAPRPAPALPPSVPPVQLAGTIPTPSTSAANEQQAWPVLAETAYGRHGTLQVALSEGGQRAVRLDGASFMIGRSPENDLQLSGSRVSRQHARIICGPNGCRIEDLGSTNGTVLGGERLRPRAPLLLEHGMVIGIGNHRLRFVAPANRANELGLPPAPPVPDPPARRPSDYPRPVDRPVRQTVFAELRPQRVSARGTGRYRLTLTNSGADRVVLRLMGNDNSGDLRFRMASRIVLQAGRQRTLNVRIGRRRLFTREGHYAFSIAACDVDSAAQNGTVAEVRGELITRGRVPAWLTLLVLLLLLAGALVTFVIFAGELLPPGWAEPIDALLRRFAIMR